MENRNEIRDTRLERGNAGVSDTVLESLAAALQLDEAEHAHLFDLARATQTSVPRKRRSRFVYTAEPGSKSEQALSLLASWTATPNQEALYADHEK